MWKNYLYQEKVQRYKHNLNDNGIVKNIKEVLYMQLSNIEKIQKSFTFQSKNFETKEMNFSKEEYLNYVVSCIKPSSSDSVLEAAAGTCACGRYLTQFVKSVTCLDITAAMLEVGKNEALKSGINNINFVNGNIEDMPFPDNSFDIVISRLAFHHFTDINMPFKEMVRVLKPNGKLVLIDMEAAEESLRNIEDEIETLRDPSHVKNLSKSEILRLFYENEIEIVKCESTKIPVSLYEWMKLTGTPAKIQNEIKKKITEDINLGLKTGFCPYVENGNIFFHQRWLLTIGKK